MGEKEARGNKRKQAETKRKNDEPAAEEGLPPAATFHHSPAYHHKSLKEKELGTAVFLFCCLMYTASKDTKRGSCKKAERKRNITLRLEMVPFFSAFLLLAAAT